MLAAVASSLRRGVLLLQKPAWGGGGGGQPPRRGEGAQILMALFWAVIILPHSLRMVRDVTQGYMLNHGRAGKGGHHTTCLCWGGWRLRARERARAWPTRSRSRDGGQHFCSISRIFATINLGMRMVLCACLV